MFGTIITMRRGGLCKESGLYKGNHEVVYKVIEILLQSGLCTEVVFIRRRSLRGGGHYTRVLF